MSWARRGWPIDGYVVLSPREEQARHVTTDETLKQDLEDSARQRGLRYCDMCGCWFQSSCFCDDFRREDI